MGENNETLRISIVIPTYNKYGSLIRTLRSLETQDIDFAQFEVIVVNDGSTDDTADWLSRYSPGFAMEPVNHTSNRGAGAARNTGFRHSAGELILYLDDDMICTPGLVRAHLDWHKKFPSDRVALLGRIVYHEEVRKMAPAITRWYESRSPAVPFEGEFPPTRFTTQNVSMKRQLLEDVGLFDEKIRIFFEDTDLGIRLGKLPGYQLRNNPDALAYHYHPRTIEWLIDKVTLAGKMDLAYFYNKFHADIQASPFSFGTFIDLLGDNPTFRNKLSRAFLRMTFLSVVLKKVANHIPSDSVNNMVMGYLFASALYKGYLESDL